MSNTICWAKFSRASLNGYSLAALSWMFRNSKIRWDLLLQVSSQMLFQKYGISEGVLVIDETDRQRSNSTKRIFKVHKLHDKKSGGTISGQTIVFLILVTPQVTIPVGFEFYMPDPELRQWKKNDKKLQKAGIPKKERPPEPKRNPAYPTKHEIALGLLEEFKANFSKIHVKGITADALYGASDFFEAATALFEEVQLISQLRNNQKIIFKNKERSLDEFFSFYPATEHTFTPRGGAPLKVWVASARLTVSAHGKKRFVIAMRYENEETYRYLVASNLSWRTHDILQAYSFRWLVEVFIQDWKSYEAWGQLTKQFDEDGSRRSLVLSLLLDHCLLLHPDQLAQVKNKLPAFTVGSLQEKTKVDSWLQYIKALLNSDNPIEQFERLAETIKTIFPLRSSDKHMSARDMGTLEPSKSLKHKTLDSLCPANSSL